MVSATADIPGLTLPTQRGRSPRLLGEVVVALGLAPHDEVEEVAARARQDGRLLGRALVDEGLIDAAQLARVIAERFGLDHVDLATYPVDPTAANLITPSSARRYGAVPIGWTAGGALRVAMADPAVVAIDDVAMLTGLDVEPAIASREDIEVLLARLDRLGDAVQLAADEQPDPDPAELLAEAVAPAEEAPVVKLVNSLLAQAVQRGASDIHFSPYRGDMRVHLRVDGVLGDEVAIPHRLRQSVVTRVKIMADLDIAERRAPQDGRFALTVDGRPIDVRVVTLPLVGGESLVMRILDRSGRRIALDELGMLPEERARFDAAYDRSHGAVLVTGPTGSGKTTSLYGALHELDDGTRSVLTIEDPVEYRMDGVRQMQVNPKAGVTFATGLRAVMRADPDVVMVGEIRDRETAQIAIEAALTGHLVLSTLHTNDAATAITRLIDMGIEPFLVASAVECVVAQRLARRLCRHCRQAQTWTAEELRASGFDVAVGLHAYEAVGCGRCGHTGYVGRVGLFEVMPMSDRLRAMTVARETSAALARAAQEEGMRRLRHGGLVRVARGDTSLAELARVTAG